MCYSVKVLLESQLKRASRHGSDQEVEEIKKKLSLFGPMDYHVVSGFEFPTILIYPNSAPHSPLPAQWGLIPHWTKDAHSAHSIRSKTLNARGETLFEKPSFRGPAQYRRCLVYLDGFYEYHHHKSKTYPHFIQRADKKPMIMAGIYDEWNDLQTGEIKITFSIVTTEGNELMSRIHNSPKLKGPRMPFILNDSQEEEWLQEQDKKALQELIKTNHSIELTAHTVQKLKGKNALGNVEDASKKFSYPELETPTFDF